MMTAHLNAQAVDLWVFIALAIALPFLVSKGLKPESLNTIGLNWIYSPSEMDARPLGAFMIVANTPWNIGS